MSPEACCPADQATQPCSTQQASTNPRVPSHATRFRSAARDAWAFFLDTVPYLLLGMTVGALVHGVVPLAWIETLLGPTNPLAVVVAALAGAPIYVGMSSMLPIAAALAEQGIPLGTVLAFVVGSAGVSLPNVILLNKLFDKTLLTVYVATVVAVGIAIGTLFNLL